MHRKQHEIKIIFVRICSKRAHLIISCEHIYLISSVKLVTVKLVILLIDIDLRRSNWQIDMHLAYWSYAESFPNTWFTITWISDWTKAINNHKINIVIFIDSNGHEHVNIVTFCYNKLWLFISVVLSHVFPDRNQLLRKWV